MLTKQQITDAALDLHKAETDRVQTTQTSQQYPGMDMEDAYAIQNAWIEIKLAMGRQVRGRKIGLTSRAMQEAMKINEPDFGTLLDDMFFDNGTSIEAGRFLDPRIEVELAFVLKNRLKGTNVSISDVMEATDYITPAIEIIAARCPRVDPQTGRTRNVLDTIADNAANAGIIVGGKAFKPNDVDLRWVGALLYRNDVIEETGLAAGVMDHPAMGLCWLARRFAPYGVALEPGQVFLTGSFTRPIAIKAGDRFRADYAPLGEITCQFE